MDDGAAALASLVALRRERQPRAVYWEARVVRVATWPAELRPDLLAACRALVACMTTIPGGDVRPVPCAESAHRIGAAEEACHACTHRVLADLLDNYSPRCMPLPSTGCLPSE